MERNYVTVTLCGPIRWPYPQSKGVNQLYGVRTLSVCLSHGETALRNGYCDALRGFCGGKKSIAANKNESGEEKVI